MKIMKMFLLLGALLFMTRCAPPQYHLDFDLKRNAFVSCSQGIKIENIVIAKKGGGIFCTIELERGSNGSSVIYLDKQNKGYYSSKEYPLKLKSNEEYIISSYWLDSGLEMSVFTNSEGKIDSVYNPLGCIEQD